MHSPCQEPACLFATAFRFWPPDLHFLFQPAIFSGGLTLVLHFLLNAQQLIFAFPACLACDIWAVISFHLSLPSKIGDSRTIRQQQQQ